MPSVNSLGHGTILLPDFFDNFGYPFRLSGWPQAQHLWKFYFSPQRNLFINQTRKSMKFFLPLTFLLTVQLANAQLLVNEEFTALANGNLSGQGGWTTVNNTSITMTADNTASLSACTGAGGRYVQTGTAATFTTERLSYPTTNFAATGSQVFYLSFVLNVLNAGTDVNAHIISTGNDFGGTLYEFMRFHVRPSGGGYQFGISEGGGTGLGTNSAGIVWNTEVLQFNRSYHMLMRYDYFSSGLNNDVIRAWANPGISAGAEPLAATALAVIAAGAQGNDILFDGDNVRNLYLNNRTGGPLYRIDGIRYARGASSAAAWLNLGISTTCIALPVNWLYAAVIKAPGNRPLIQWEVAEDGVAHYIVERSIQGDPFTEVGRLASLGNGQYRYELADPSYTTGRAIYRIRQVDLDGNYSYSHLLYFNENDIERSYVFPNPASRVMTLIVKPSLINSQALLYNVSGQVVERVSVNGIRTDITCERLEKGLYILKLQDGTVLRIIKD